MIVGMSSSWMSSISISIESLLNAICLLYVELLFSSQSSSARSIFSVCGLKSLVHLVMLIGMSRHSLSVRLVGMDIYFSFRSIISRFATEVFVSALILMFIFVTAANTAISSVENNGLCFSFIRLMMYSSIVSTSSGFFRNASEDIFLSCICSNFGSEV